MAGYIGNKSQTLVDGYTTTEADAEFVNDPNDVITVSGGNVGIGTSGPTEKLEVNGWIKTGQGVSYNGGLMFPYSGNSTDSRTWGIRNDVHDYGDIGFITSNSQTGDITAGGQSDIRMRIDSAGRVTMPYQPAFFASKSSDTTITSGMASFDFDFGNVAFNIGNHYNNSTSTFTAPVAGTYYFAVQLYTGFSSGGVRVMHASWKINGALAGTFNILGGASADGGVYYHPTGIASTMVYLNAGDTVRVTMSTLSGTFATGTLYSDSISSQCTHFTGYLIG